MANHDFPRLGFIGAGKMSTAIIKGILRSKLTTPERIFASDVITLTKHPLASTSIRLLDSNLELVRKCDVVFLAVKPQILSKVLQEIRPVLSPEQLVVSIAAGTSLKHIAQELDSGTRIIRVMPNTPCLVGAGAVAFCRGSHATPVDVDVVERIFETISIIHEVGEAYMDAVTGLSASGPAYVAVMIEAMSDGGVRCGLSREMATSLAAQTVLGAARMLLEEKLHPAQLKDMVASPGGTTIAGLHALERETFRGSVIDAIVAAAKRSAELGKGNGA